MDRYVPHHAKQARLVTKEDLPRILQGDNTQQNPGEMSIMYALCYTARGRWATAYAIAHTQIDDTDPLAFFVTQDARVIINPKITRHTQAPKFVKEGCMSQPDRATVLVPRFYRIEMEYQTIDGQDNLTDVLCCELKGLQAQIYQHEIDHLNGKCVYDEL